MAYEARVVQLQTDLVKLGFFDALRALNWMIGTMNANNGYKRFDGSHYYYHLVDGAQDLLNHGIRDQIVITSYIVHDSDEDIEEVTNELIAEEFGKEVAFVVAGVTKDPNKNYKIPENLDEMLAEILLDVRRCLVKTADRKHNFSTLESATPKHELRTANETLKHFIPFFKQARKKYPEYSNYFHSAKTTIMPHLKRIHKAHDDVGRLENKIKQLEYQRSQCQCNVRGGC